MIRTSSFENKIKPVPAFFEKIIRFYNNSGGYTQTHVYVLYSALSHNDDKHFRK